MSKVAKKLLGKAPKTLEEAADRVINLLTENGDGYVLSETEGSFVGGTHHGIGQSIRNYWGLWSMDSDLYKELAGKSCLSHPDDLSGLVLIAAYRKYNDLPFNLNQEAARYHAHWAEMLK